MQSVNILIQALQQYEGTYIVVSHDRYFVENIANKIWFIEDQEIKEYPGTFDEYEEWQATREKSDEKPIIEKVKEKSEPVKVVKSSPSNEKLIQQLEDKIVNLETQKEDLQHQMAELAQNSKFEELKQQEIRLNDINLELTNLTTEWERLLS